MQCLYQGQLIKMTVDLSIIGHHCKIYALIFKENRNYFNRVPCFLRNGDFKGVILIWIDNTGDIHRHQRRSDKSLILFHLHVYHALKYFAYAVVLTNVSLFSLF